jgi:NADH dehydrogenase
MSRKRFVTGLITGLAVAVPVALALRKLSAGSTTYTPAHPLDTSITTSDGAGRRRPRVVILGGGFAGLTAIRELANANVDITLIDRTNHHLFQPLLYQVALGQLAPTDITAPLRWLVHNQRNATVLLGEAIRIDVDRKVVVMAESAIATSDDRQHGNEVFYDYLILTTGARHSYFGHDEWEPLAPGLKTIDDALEVRRRFLTAFERAEEAADLAESNGYLNFAIIGGGPTGVELAGLLVEIGRQTMRPDFRHVDTSKTRVILLEGGPRLLASFPPELSNRAKRDLERFGVEVRLNTRVTRVEADAVYVGDERIPARTVFWAAGNQASPLAKSLGAPLDKVGRIRVEPNLSIPGHPEIFAAGDITVFEQDGSQVPGVAPAANQEGHTAAVNVKRSIMGQERVTFRYFDKGNLATIGRQSAIADFGFLRVAGPLAWWLWLFVHIMYLVGFRNRASVLFEWAYAYFTNQRGARLITHIEHVQEPKPKVAANTAQ